MGVQPAGAATAATTFIGRGRESDHVLAALDGHRVVTIVGPGGAGKTRLAIEVAARLDGDVRLVELAPVGDGEVVAAIAAVLGPTDTASDAAGLAATIADQHVVLVLDNAEHVLGAAGDVAGVLVRSCPHLRILATSRHPLRLAFEHVVPLAPMDADEARQLLITRAAQVGTTLTDAPAVTRLCARLDHLPLAIELAAAQLRDHGVEELEAALADRFRVLVDRGGALDPRHRTLRATIDASHARLDPAARALLAAASVFRDWFTRADLAALHDGHPHLSDLVDASLVVVDAGGPVARFRLLEAVADYARQQLEAAGDAAAVCERLVRWALDLTEAHPLGTHHEVANLQRLDAAVANLHTALDAAAGSDALTLAVRLGPYWERRGAFGDGRSRLERLIASDGADAAPALVVAAHVACGRLALQQADLPGAERAFAAAEALASNDRDRAVAVAGRGRVARREGRYELAEALLSKALKVLRREGADGQVALCLGELGRLASLVGRRSDGTAFLTEAITLWRRQGDRGGTLDATVSLAKAAEADGDFVGAEQRLREAVHESRELGDPQLIAAMLSHLADVLYLREGVTGRYLEPEQLHLECLDIAVRIGDRRREASALNALGTINYRRTDFEAAIRYWQRTLEISQSIGDRRTTIATLGALANVEAMTGDVERGWIHVSEALHRQRELGEPRALVLMLHPATEIARDRERWEDAYALAAEMERCANDVDDRRSALLARYHTAYVSIVGGRPETGLLLAVETAAAALAIDERHTAARCVEAAATGLAAVAGAEPAAAELLGIAESLRGESVFTTFMRPSVRRRHDAAVEHLKDVLGGGYEPALAQGRRATVATAATRAAAAVRRHTSEPALAAPSGPRQGTWRLAGAIWTVGLDGEEAVVPDTKGMHYLARLLASPGHAFAATGLAGAGVDQPGLAVADAAALRAYRRHLRAIERGGGRSDDLGHLTQAVTGAQRADGAVRLERGTGERARKAVTKCIREAIARLEAPAPALAAHLLRSVTTGTCCTYLPEQEVSWSVTW